MNDVIDYKAEFHKASQAVVVLQEQLSAKTKLIETLQNKNESLKLKYDRLKNENIALKNAIIEKYLGVDFDGDNDV